MIKKGRVVLLDLLKRLPMMRVGRPLSNWGLIVYSYNSIKVMALFAIGLAGGLSGTAQNASSSAPQPASSSKHTITVNFDYDFSKNRGLLEDGHEGVCPGVH
jgi:hypothetical protein